MSRRRRAKRAKIGIFIHQDRLQLNQAVELAKLLFEQARITKRRRPRTLHLHPDEVPSGLSEVDGLQIVADKYVDPGYLIIFSA